MDNTSPLASDHLVLNLCTAEGSLLASRILFDQLSVQREKSLYLVSMKGQVLKTDWKVWARSEQVMTKSSCGVGQ